MNEEGVEFFFSSFDLVVSAIHEEQVSRFGWSLPTLNWCIISMFWRIVEKVPKSKEKRLKAARQSGLNLSTTGDTELWLVYRTITVELPANIYQRSIVYFVTEQHWSSHKYSG